MTIQNARGDLGLTNMEVLPFICPTDLTQVVTGDAYLTEVQIWVAPNGSASASVVVQDCQGTPVAALSTRILNGEGQNYVFNSRTTKGGISVQTDAPSVVSIYLRWKS